MRKRQFITCSARTCRAWWRRQRRPTERVSPMHPSEKFLKHAAECKRMARFARELQDKVTWGQMSERWLRCAELSEKKPGRLAPGADKASLWHHRSDSL